MLCCVILHYIPPGVLFWPRINADGESAYVLFLDITSTPITSNHSDQRSYRYYATCAITEIVFTHGADMLPTGCRDVRQCLLQTRHQC